MKNLSSPMVTGEIYDQMKYFNRYPTRSLTPPFETSQIFRCVRISIRGLVRRSVGWSVGRSVGRSVRNAFVKIAEKWTFTESEWFRQCWTRKKEARGGKRDEESEKMKKLLKNEKIAKGRIIGLAGPCCKSITFEIVREDGRCWLPLTTL